MTRRGARAGFTLVEVIVGLAVGGIVLVAGFTALATVQDRSLHAREATTHALEGATARALLVEWLATATLTASVIQTRFEIVNGRLLGLTWDEITFPTRARTPLRTPVTGVRLYVDTDPMTPETGLVAELVGSLLMEPTRMEIDPRVTGLLIRYLPVGEGPMEWVGSSGGPEAFPGAVRVAAVEGAVTLQQLPRAVELTLLSDPTNPLPPLLALPIRIPLATLQ